MSDLHPTARSLIASAKRRETPLSEQARQRVHGSVIRRAAAFGSAVATTTSASVAAKAGAVVAALANPLVKVGLGVAVAAASLAVVHAVGRAPAPSVPRAALAVSVPGAAPRATPPVAAHSPPSLPMAEESTRATEAQPLASDSAFAPPTAVDRPQSFALPVLARERFPRASPPAVPLAAEPTPPADTTSAEAFPAPPASPLLAQSVEVLRTAREALRAGEGSRALLLLDRNATMLQGGLLAEEASAARVAALCQLGRDAEARSQIDRFLAAWPRSPLATRVHGGCPGLQGPPALERASGR